MEVTELPPTEEVPDTPLAIELISSSRFPSGPVTREAVNERTQYIHAFHTYRISAAEFFAS